MPISVGCYLKQRSKACYYNELIKLEKEVERLKAGCSYVENEIKQIEISLKKGQLSRLYKIMDRYYDGFSWGSQQGVLGIPPFLKTQQELFSRDSKKCPYDYHTCETYKMKRQIEINSLKKKLYQKISYHNQLMSIGSILKREEEQGSISLSSLLVNAHLNINKHQICYFNRTLFNPTQSSTYEMKGLISYLDTYLPIKSTLTFYYEPWSQGLRGTIKDTQVIGSKMVLLQALEEWTVEEGFFLQSLLQFLRILNVQHGKKYGVIRAVYGKLSSDLSLGQKEKQIRFFKKYGFEILGCSDKKEGFLLEQMVYHPIPDYRQINKWYPKS